MDGTPSMLHRVLIVDRTPRVREALRWALENEPDLAVVGEAGDGASARDRAAELAPDLVLLDIALPDLDGHGVARALKALPRPPVVICLATHDDTAARAHATAEGGDGFAGKSGGWPSLIAEVRRALAGRPPGPARGSTPRRSR